jgi:hypothetical protein
MCVFPGQYSVYPILLDKQEVSGSIPLRPTTHESSGDPSAVDVWGRNGCHTTIRPQTSKSRGLRLVIADEIRLEEEARRSSGR